MGPVKERLGNRGVLADVCTRESNTLVCKISYRREGHVNHTPWQHP